MPDLNSTNSGSYGPGDLPIIPWVYIQRQASVLINKWWSVQVRLQIYDDVEVHYYDAKYSHIELHLPLRVPEWSSGDFTFGFLSITENGFFTQRKKETAKKTIIGDAA